MNAVETFLWVIVAYICIAVFVLGHVWRYRYDKFGWTTRSSQLYETRLLRLGSPLFHYGIILVLLGHIGGIAIPKTVFDSIGLHETAYHLLAMTLGGISGAMTLFGLAILIYRRRTVGPVFSATTRNDKVMYLLLGIVIAAGAAATAFNGATGGYDYRTTVAPYFRSIFYAAPRASLIAHAPVLFQIHAFAAWLMFAMWPFTRLVHFFSAPLGYLTRPYVVYRSRDPRAGIRAVRRGWDRTAYVETRARR